MRGVIKFTINEHPLELRPALRGYHIVIDGKVRYAGIAFTLPEAVEKLTNLARTEDIKILSKRTGVLKVFDK